MSISNGAISAPPQMSAPKKQKGSLTYDVSENAKLPTGCIDFRAGSVVAFYIATATDSDFEAYGWAGTGAPADPDALTAAEQALFKPIYAEGTQVKIAAADFAQGQWHVFVGDDAAALMPFDYIMFRSATDQAADRTMLYKVSA